jgi:hypothetical protein
MVPPDILIGIADTSQELSPSVVFARVVCIVQWRAVVDALKAICGETFEM